MDLVALLQAKFGPKRARVHHIIQEDGYNVGYLSKEPICTPQVCEKVMLFKPKMMDKVCVQLQYLEKIGLKRAKSSGSKQKEQQDASKEGKKKKKWGKDKKTTTTTHQ